MRNNRPQPKIRGGIFANHPLTAVFAFTFVCLLPAMLTRDFTPSNELRYLSIADEALANGHLFAFYNHGIPYADKPPLYFWIVMLCRWLTGHHSIFALSLFSILPAFGIVSAMDRMVMKGKSAMDRMALAMMTLTCVMFLGTMVVLRMDMLMCLFITLAIATFYRMYSGQGKRKSDSALLPVWIFLALFTKGPVGLLMPPLAIAVFLAVKRDWKGFRKYLGLKTWGIIAGLAAIWLTCVWFEGGAEYIDNLLFKQTMGRAVNAFTHAKPFWFYLMSIWWCLAPYCLLLMGSLIVSLIPTRHLPSACGSSATPSSKRSDLEILFLCTIVSTIVMLSCFSSKLPIYLVPVFPFIVYLFPILLGRTGERRWMLWAVGVFTVLFIIVGAGAILILSGAVSVPAVNELLYEYSFVREMPVLNGVILLTLANCIGLWFIVKRKCWNIPSFLLGAGLLLAVFSASAVMREINPFLGYGAICSKVSEGTDVATVFLHRPENIDAYIGRQITDYGKDCDKLTEDVRLLSADSEDQAITSATDRPETRPLTIITLSTKLDEHPDLKAIFSSGSTLHAGPYCLTTVATR